MKSSIVFYFFLLGSIFMNGSIDYPIKSTCPSEKLKALMLEPCLLKTDTLLRVLCHDNQKYGLIKKDDVIDLDDDILISIINLISETYEKIVTITVTYYIAPSTTHINLQQEIMIIVHQEIIKTMKVLSKKLTTYLLDKNISWRKKIGRSLIVACIIMFVKMCIEEIPKFIDIEQNVTINNVQNNNQEIIILGDENSYLSDKFDNYK